MGYCQICYTGAELLRLSCGCGYCKKCLFEWFKGQLTAFFQDDARLTCPASRVQHPLSDQDALNACTTPEQLTHMQSLLTKFSLSRLDFTRSCPSSACGYIGWVDPATTCFRPLQCPVCHTTWKEPGLAPWYLTILTTVVNLVFGLKEEESSQMWKWMWTKSCPNCHVAIEKNGGCSSMNCYKCKVPFCWTCLKLRTEHNSEVCLLIYYHTSLIAVILILALLVKLALIHPEFGYPLSVFVYIFGVFVYILAVLIAVGITSEVARHPRDKWSYVGMLTCWAVLAFLSWWLLTSNLGEVVIKHVCSLLLLGVQCTALLIYLRL